MQSSAQHSYSARIGLQVVLFKRFSTANKEQSYLSAAQGFVELGMYLDADAALDDIDPFCRHLPEVLAVRLQIYRALQKWELMQTVAKNLVEEEAENEGWWLAWAEATMHVDSLDAARRILVNALEVHEDEASLYYYLACYECQFGDVDSAKVRLKKCFEIDPEMRLKALEETGLHSLWDQI